MNKAVSIILVLVVLLGGFLLLKGKDETVELGMPAPNATGTPEMIVGEGLPNTSEVKEFRVEGGMFYFNPSTMTVNKGDTVRIVFTNKEGMHDWALDKFNAKTKVLKVGETETIEFVAGEAGSFEYYCSVGDHRARGMKGTLTVVDVER
jgi:nitrosocyanin